MTIEAPAPARADRWLALVCLPVVHVVLRLAGAAPARRLLGLLPPSRSPAPTPGLVVEAVERSARRLHLGNCLTRSLTAQGMLRRHGLPGELRIGVHRTAGGFAAHAWLEADGEVLNDEPSIGERFTAFDGPMPEVPTSRPTRAG